MCRKATRIARSLLKDIKTNYEESKIMNETFVGKKQVLWTMVVKDLYNFVFFLFFFFFSLLCLNNVKYFLYPN